MKQFEVKTIELDELSLFEMEMINGGAVAAAIPWGKIFQWLIRVVGEAAAAWGVSEALDYLTSTGDDDWVYWSYGGELEPAICEG